MTAFVDRLPPIARRFQTRRSSRRSFSSTSSWSKPSVWIIVFLSPWTWTPIRSSSDLGDVASQPLAGGNGLWSPGILCPPSNGARTHPPPDPVLPITSVAHPAVLTPSSIDFPSPVTMRVHSSVGDILHLSAPLLRARQSIAPLLLPGHASLRSCPALHLSLCVNFALFSADASFSQSSVRPIASCRRCLSRYPAG